MTGATCKNNTRRSSKFKTAVRGDDRIEGIDTPNPAVHPQFGHVAPGSFFRRGFDGFDDFTAMKHPRHGDVSEAFLLRGIVFSGPIRTEL